MKRPRRRTRWGLCVLLANVPAVTGCYTASSYQSARITRDGTSRATFGIARMGSSDEDNEGRLTVLDMRVRKAVATGRADIGFTATVFTAEGGALATVGVEPRVAVVDGILTLGLPMTWYIGLPAGQVAPGAVLTIPVSRHLEINGAARISTLVTSYGSLPQPVFNVGLGISEDLSRWALRPEVGFTRIEEEDEWLVQLGIGIEPPAPAAN